MGGREKKDIQHEEEIKTEKRVINTMFGCINNAKSKCSTHYVKLIYIFSHF